jgi:hypothetical protein
MEPLLGAKYDELARLVMFLGSEIRVLLHYRRLLVSLLISGKTFMTRRAVVGKESIR